MTCREGGRPLRLDLIQNSNDGLFAFQNRQPGLGLCDYISIGNCIEGCAGFHGFREVVKMLLFAAREITCGGVKIIGGTLRILEAECHNLTPFFGLSIEMDPFVPTLTPK